MIEPSRARRRRLLPTPLVAAVALLALALGVLAERANLFPAFRLAVQWTPAAIPSSGAVPATEVQRGQPTLSLVLAEADLWDPARGLLTNTQERGDKWERSGSVSYFDRGQLLFATGVGVRIHGGGSRLTSRRQSFRLLFRRRYGAREFPPGLAFGPDAKPLRRLVAHNDVRIDSQRVAWHLLNPLAYDIAQAMGATVPATRPVRFFLNGEFQGVYVLSERIDEHFLRGRFGHDKIDSNQLAFNDLAAWIRASRPLTMRKAAEIVDLENLTRWFLSVMFCGTGDAYQGPSQFIDRSRPEASWFWLNWDMDGSFRQWLQDPYEQLLLRPGEPTPGRNRAEPRPMILSDLLATDPEYRAYFQRVFDEVMNYRVTPAFLRERYDHYLDIAGNYGIEDTEYLGRVREFLEQRPAFLRLVTEQWLNVPPSVSVHVTAAPGIALRINGFAVSLPFEGHYVPGTGLELEPGDGSMTRFSHWAVSGRPVETRPRLRVSVDAPLDIRLIVRDDAASSASVSVPVPPSAESRPSAPMELPVLRGPAIPVRAEIGWVRIPAGSFEMGCVPADTDCASNEQPRQRVAVARPFDLMDRETTVGQFQAYSQRGGHPLPRQAWYATAEHPVVNVTWEEARAFCESLGARLPSEAEWERAARGGLDGTIYPWGDVLAGQANATDRRARDRWIFTAPVGQFPPNPYGLFDMSGNVWEWTADWYRNSYNKPPIDVDEPGSRQALRVIRGGGWDNRRANLRTSIRAGLSPHGRYHVHVGFRCARDIR